MLEAILVEGLIYGLMVLGVFITFRILDFPDLTVDGSFPLGAAIMAMMLVNNVNPFIALIVVFAAGVTAGCVTAFIHNKLKVLKSKLLWKESCLKVLQYFYFF